MERYNPQLFFSLHKVYHLLLQLKETKAVEKVAPNLKNEIEMVKI